MHKIIMCACLLVNITNFNQNIKVERIEYKKEKNDCINLKIELYSSIRDVVEMKIYFYDIGGVLLSDDYFVSSLVIEGKKSTVAKVPFLIEDEMLLDIEFYSDNYKGNFEKIMFPIYPSENETCYLSKHLFCESKTPGLVVFEKNEIEEYYDKVSLVNKNLKYFSFKNNIPVGNIKISTSQETFEGYVSLHIYQKIKEFGFYYNEEYLFPLLIEKDNNIVSFSFENKYYLDLKNGKSYENYFEDTIYVNQLILPYIDENYKMMIELINCFISFERVVIDIEVVTKGNLYGQCKDSKYCLRRNYL